MSYDDIASAPSTQRAVRAPAIGATAMDQPPARLEEPSRANHVAMYFGGILITHARHRRTRRIQNP